MIRVFLSPTEFSRGTNRFVDIPSGDGWDLDDDMSVTIVNKAQETVGYFRPDTWEGIAVVEED